MHRTLAGAIVGSVFTWMGIGLAIWARYHLAEYWSARVTIKEDHQLIRTGPYARLRHPIYSGLILAAIGSAVVIDQWRCVLGVCLVLTGILHQGEEGRSDANPAIRRGFPRAPETRRLSDPTLPLKRMISPSR